MNDPTERSARWLQADKVVAILLAALLQPACDCFFHLGGMVTDCATGAPIAGVAVDVHVDRGFDDRMESFPGDATTNASGAYHIGLNDPCESWATLTFHRDGYAPLTPPQIHGHTDSDPPLDVCLASTTPN